MKINYKKLRKNIPNKIRTAPRSFYEILWSDSFHFDQPDGRKTYGLTRFDPQQIVINSNQADKECLHTLWHEVAHALSDEFETGLTETQVVSVEKWFPAIRELVLALEGYSKKAVKK
jgi:Zn-dependent peptidase ImmA (M78 family)